MIVQLSRVSLWWSSDFGALAVGVHYDYTFNQASAIDYAIPINYLKTAPKGILASLAI